MPIYGNTCIYILIYKAVKSNDGSIFGRTSILKTCLMFVIRRLGQLTVVFIKIITWLIMISHFLRTSSYNKSNLHISLIAHQPILPSIISYLILFLFVSTMTSAFLIIMWGRIQSSSYYWTLITVLSLLSKDVSSVIWYPLIFQVW